MGSSGGCRGLLAGSMRATSQLLNQFLHTPGFPYHGTSEHKGQKIWIKQARKEKRICDAATVIWRVAPQGTTACPHCSHWGGGGSHGQKTSAPHFHIHGARQARPDRASNRLGKLSWVPGQGLHRRWQPSTAVTTRFPDLLWTSKRCHFMCLWLNLIHTYSNVQTFFWLNICFTK